ncbi:MAG: ornithine carbamoyltransferase [Alphaproteobacteria bacterium]|nr:ornithine carbamoyltransferase [Alphaproteobacteria bacterium]
MRHFLDLNQIDKADLRAMIDQAKAIKKKPQDYRRLEGKVLALVFEKPSTRTRVSFEVGMLELGGDVVALTGAEMQLGHGETLGDTARVMSRFVHVMMVRTFEPTKLTEMAKAASIPIINGLTNDSHPCQVMADIMTFEERVGPITGRRITWVGDGNNNILASLIHASAAFGFKITIASPADLAPLAELVAWANSNGGHVAAGEDPFEAAEGSDAIVTDTWVSMHDKDVARRHSLLEPYRVTSKLMSAAAPGAIFMHCLPAHRGEEVTDDVIDGPQSVVWDEAENRKHAQKAVLLWCLGREKA